MPSDCLRAQGVSLNRLPRGRPPSQTRSQKFLWGLRGSSSYSVHYFGKAGGAKRIKIHSAQVAGHLPKPSGRSRPLVVDNTWSQVLTGAHMIGRFDLFRDFNDERAAHVRSWKRPVEAVVRTLLPGRPIQHTQAVDQTVIFTQKLCPATKKVPLGGVSWFNCYWHQPQTVCASWQPTAVRRRGEDQATGRKTAYGLAVLDPQFRSRLLPLDNLLTQPLAKPAAENQISPTSTEYLLPFDVRKI